MYLLLLYVFYAIYAIYHESWIYIVDTSWTHDVVSIHTHVCICVDDIYLRDVIFHFLRWAIILVIENTQHTWEFPTSWPNVWKNEWMLESNSLIYQIFMITLASHHGQEVKPWNKVASSHFSQWMIKVWSRKTTTKSTSDGLW